MKICLLDKMKYTCNIIVVINRSHQSNKNLRVISSKIIRSKSKMLFSIVYQKVNSCVKNVNNKLYRPRGNQQLNYHPLFVYIFVNSVVKYLSNFSTNIISNHQSFMLEILHQDITLLLFVLVKLLGRRVMTML